MDISSDLAVIALLLAGLLAYVAFHLWTPQKKLEPTNKLIGFLLSSIFSILLGFVYLLGFTLSGTVFSLMTFGHIVSYILAGICSIFICAYTIKSLPSKIGDGTTFHWFCNISFVLYILIGIGEIVTALSLNSVFSTFPNSVFDNTVLGISNIGGALCAVCIRPSVKTSPAAPETLPSVPALVSSQEEDPSADTSDPEQNNLSVVKNVPDSAAPSCVPAAQLQKDPVASPKAVIHFSVSKKVLLTVAFVAVLLVGVLVGLLLGEGYFAPNFTPSSPYIDSLKDSVEDAHSEGYQKGYFAGKDVGKQSWYADGYDAGLSDGYGAGYSGGYEDGYNEGYDDGYFAY